MKTAAVQSGIHHAPAPNRQSIVASIKRALLTEVLGLADIPADRRMVTKEDDVRISDSEFDIGPSFDPIIHVPTSCVHGVILSPIRDGSNRVDAIIRTKRRPGSLREFLRRHFRFWQQSSFRVGERAPFAQPWLVGDQFGGWNGQLDQLSSLFYPITTSLA